ncbi:MAG: hypothetical protein QOJ99_3798, partial [Bryobacterales bacterium]|nr:hypothetical protein [Bryobacterales bacterium]
MRLLPIALLTASVSCSLASAQELTNLHQLTSGGENAEAYWSPDGKRLI